VDTQPSGLYRYSQWLPNQPKHKSPPNGLTDFLRGMASEEIHRVPRSERQWSCLR